MTRQRFEVFTQRHGDTEKTLQTHPTPESPQTARLRKLRQAVSGRPYEAEVLAYLADFHPDALAEPES
jgi:hypothetical protein